MGFLQDLRGGKTTGRLISIFVWLFVGGGVGALVGNYLPGAAAAAVLTFLGCLVGLGLGLYAAFGVSRMARILALPDAIVHRILPW